MKRQHPRKHLRQRPRKLRGERYLTAPTLGQVRIETGMFQFKGDWPGLFIRGDDAIGVMVSIREVINAAYKIFPPILLVETASHMLTLSEIADLIRRAVVVKSKQ